MVICPLKNQRIVAKEDKSNINDIISMDIERLLNEPHLPDEQNPYTFTAKQD